MNDARPDPISLRPLAPDLTEAVLERLGFAAAPEPTLAGLDALYGAHCHRVPFDNVQKRLHVARGGGGALPGSSAEELWRAWLTHGTGGTCWAGSGALGALLAACGFTVHRATATMNPGPHAKDPNHGTLVVDLDGERYLVDHSTTNGVALPLVGSPHAPALGGAHVTRGEGGETLLVWRPLHNPAGMPCRLDTIGVEPAVFEERHEATRAWSLFNPALHARIARDGGVVGIAMGLRIAMHADGSVSARALDDAERVRVLVEELGIAEETARAIPADEPLSPPPGMPPERWAPMLAGMMAGLPRPSASRAA